MLHCLSEPTFRFKIISKNQWDTASEIFSCLLFIILKSWYVYKRNYCPLTLYCLPRQICDAVPKFCFNLRRDHHKNFLWASRLWVGRQKEPTLGYVPKNYEKKIQAVKGKENENLQICLTLYSLARQICDAVPKFWFQFKKGSSKKFSMSVATMSR